jgi:hypothetical protein
VGERKPTKQTGFVCEAKTEGKMRNHETTNKSSARGLPKTEKNFRWVISKHFDIPIGNYE